MRFLIPFAAGIVTAWYGQYPPLIFWIIAGSCIAALIAFAYIPVAQRYRFAWVGGAGVCLFLFSSGCLLSWYKDARNDPRWLGRHQNSDALFIATLGEPLVEKTRSWKAEASVTHMFHGKTMFAVSGNVLLYFRKDSTRPALTYGTRLIIHKPLQEINGATNPGGFDYRRYCLFQGVTHQVFLQPKDYRVLPGDYSNTFQKMVYPLQANILAVLREYIEDGKAAGLAEALLIGYKNDLDKTLVQSYTNTGVVHVIAISGLHIGLIYWLLLLVLKPVQRLPVGRWLQPLLIIGGLWGFSLLAGAQASVLRSALMFTCLVIAKSIQRNSSGFNTLALSAFLLLCYNPFWLWDVGFQLSYAAVLSIMIFGKAVYNWWFIKNRLLDHLWQLNAVTFAAQILTLPFTLYHFHQFPVYFPLTNVVAVPLSSLVVLGEILLCAISFAQSMATCIGCVLGWLINMMNGYIESIEAIPGSLVDSIPFSLVEAIMTIILIGLISLWLQEKWKCGRQYSIALTAALVGTIISNYQIAANQSAIVVYHVPGMQAIDFIQGSRHVFRGDTSLTTGNSITNFHLKPARVQFRVSPVGSLDDLLISKPFVLYRGLRILLIDTNYLYQPFEPGLPVDLAIISGNPRLYIRQLVKSFHIKQIVFDASVSSKRLVYWRKDCDSLRIPYHSIGEKGAFVMTLN